MVPEGQLSTLVVEMGKIKNQLLSPPPLLVHQVLIDIDEGDVQLLAMAAIALIYFQGVIGTFFIGGGKGVGKSFFPPFRLSSPVVSGGDHVKNMYPVPLLPQPAHVGEITGSSPLNKFQDRHSCLLMLVLDMNTDIHFTKTEDQFLFPQRLQNPQQLLFMPLQVIRSLAVQFIVTNQDPGIGNRVVMLKTAPGMAVPYGKNFSMHLKQNSTKESPA